MIITEEIKDTYGITAEDIRYLYSKRTVTIRGKNYVIEEEAYFCSTVTNNYVYCLRKQKDKATMDQAIRFLRLAHHFCPDNMDVCYRCFDMACMNNEWGLAIECIRTLLKTEDRIYLSNIKFYLFLLSYITILPEDLALISKSIRFEDICNPSDNPENRSTVLHINNVRNKAFNGSFASAKVELDKIRNIRKNNMHLALRLLHWVSLIDKERNKMLLIAIKAERYDLALKYIDVSKKYRKINHKEEEYRAVLVALLDMQLSNRLPANMTTNDISTYNKDYWRAIQMRDYKSAFDICDVCFSDDEDKGENSPIFVLLRQITTRIGEMQEERERINNMLPPPFRSCA